MNQEVIAVVAGKEITQAEFDAFLQGLPREQQAYISNPQFKKQCLEQFLALHMFAELGADEKLEETEEFQTIMESAKRDILAQLAIRETMKSVAVSEEEIKAYYEENKQQFAKGPSVRAKHILMEAEEKCKEVLEMIRSGARTFEDAAKEHSTCPSSAKGGDLGEFTRGQMVKEFENAAFDAEIGDIVGPVKTQFGYHLIKVEAKNDAQETPLENVKDNIQTQLLRQKQTEAYEKKVEELKEKYLQK